MQVIQTELKAVGIQITPDNLSQNDFLARLYNGDYQLAYNNKTGGPSPYYEFRQWLYSANSAPIGKNASTNWERYSNPATDALINQYAATTATAQQQQIVDQLQQVMLQDVPIIPVTEEVAWYPVQHQQIHRLGDAEQPVRGAGRVLPARRGSDAAAPRAQVSGKPVKGAISTPDGTVDECASYCAGAGSSCSRSGRRSR